MSLDNALLLVFAVLAVVNALAVGVSLKLACSSRCPVDPKDRYMAAVILLLVALCLDIFAAVTMFTLFRGM